MTDILDKDFRQNIANWAGSWDFKDGDRILTIVDVKYDDVRSEMSGTEKKYQLVTDELEHPIILNKTNLKMLHKVTKSPIPRDWIGKKIVVGTEKTRGKGGEIVDGIRIKDRAVTASSMEKATTPQLKAILDMVDAGAINQPNLLRFYKIEQLNQLTRQQAMEIIRSKTGEVIE